MVIEYLSTLEKDNAYQRRRVFKRFEERRGVGKHVRNATLNFVRAVKRVTDRRIRRVLDFFLGAIL